MDYPNYARHQDGRYKLTEADVVLIRQLKDEGMSQRALARKFKVSKTTIMRHTDAGQRQKLIDRSALSVVKRRLECPEVIKLIDQKRRKKKRKLMPLELNQYAKERMRIRIGWRGHVYRVDKSYYR